MRTSFLLAAALVVSLVPSAALAQWKPGGVALPLTPLDDWYSLVPDGAGGAYFLYVPIFPPREVRAQHVLGNGTLDPRDGTTGQLVVATPYGVGTANAVADGAGGVLVSLQRCGFPQAHTRCYETGEDRLARWQAGGTVGGWPDSGASVGPCLPYVTPPPLVGDGSGGAILRIGDVLARWAGDGSRPWTPEPGRAGVRVSTSARAHRNLGLAGDGAGGAWALWDEDTGFDPSLDDVLLNHVSAGGIRELGDEGMYLAEGENFAAGGVVADGSGGVFVAWSERQALPGGGFADSFLVQHLDAGASPLWDPAGVRLGPVPYLSLVAAGEDALALLVLDASGRPRVQKLVSGAPAWPAFPGGVPVGVPGVTPAGIRVLPGANGSLFVAWCDARSGSLDLYVTRLDAAGQPAPGWTLAGTALANTPADECAAWMIPGANEGEVIVSWWRPSAYVTLYDLVVQKVASDGVLAVPPPAAAALALAPPWPNPARDGWTVRFSLPAAGRADLELFDVAGRRVWRDRVELGAPGPAEVRIAPRGLAEGVYRLRLRGTAGERTRTLVLTR